MTYNIGFNEVTTEGSDLGGKLQVCGTVKFLLCSPLGLIFSATFRSEAKEKIKVVGQKLRDRGFLLIFI